MQKRGQREVWIFREIKDYMGYALDVSKVANESAPPGSPCY